MKTYYWKVLLGLFLVFAISACGGDKYKEARSVMADHAKASESYLNGMNNAKSADDVVDTVNKFTDDMKTIIPRLKALHEKYPDWWVGGQASNVPEELQAEGKRLEDLSGKMQSATMNIMKYMMDPKVQQAMQRMGQELGALGE